LSSLGLTDVIESRETISDKGHNELFTKVFLQFLLLVSCVFFLIFIWACLLELCFALVVGGVSLIFDGISVVLVHHRMLSSGEGACGDLYLFSLMPNFHVHSLKYYLMKFWGMWLT